MGRLLAWELQRRGHRVTLFDRDGADGGSAAAYTAAGMLAPFSELESAESPVYAMGRRSLQLWPGIVAALGGDVDFHQRGSLIVAHGGDLPDLLRFRQQVHAKLAPGPELYRCLGAAELRALEPELAENFSAADYLPEEAWLATDRVMAALRRQLVAGGAGWHERAPVQALAAGCIHSGGRRYDFDRVVDCRGLGARADVAGLRGVRGEVMLLRAPEVAISHMVRLMHPRYRLYLVPREHSHYVIGATQIESDDMGEITVRSALELLSAAYTLHSGFAEARVLACRSNCRPALPDNLPAILLDDGVVRVNGLFRHGFLLAPVLVEQLLAHWRLDGAAEARFGELIQEVAVP